MILIVGLGNPGKKYQKTRHSLGFRAVDEFHKKNRDVYNFSDFRLQKELSSFISKGEFNDEKIILAKPQAFMNLSGKSVKLLTKPYTLDPKNLIIVHDDIDLPLGKIRISKGRGAAGHKGVESIIKELGTRNFVRFRIGIQSSSGKPKNAENFVLQEFNKEEEKIVKEVIKKTAKAIKFFVKKGLEKTMNKFNK